MNDQPVEPATPKLGVLQSNRKYRFSLLAVAVIFAGACIAAWKTWPTEVFTKFVDGVNWVVTTYLTGNVIQKYVAAKASNEATKIAKQPANPDAD